MYIILGENMAEANQFTSPQEFVSPEQFDPLKEEYTRVSINRVLARILDFGSVSKFPGCVPANYPE
jgi:hypothetical protein